MVVGRIINGTGVLKVYLVQSKRYTYRLHFVRALAPGWVLETLKDIDLDTDIGLEQDGDEVENHWYDVINAIEDQSKQLLKILIQWLMKRRMTYKSLVVKINKQWYWNRSNQSKMHGLMPMQNKKNQMTSLPHQKLLLVLFLFSLSVLLWTTHWQG